MNVTLCFNYNKERLLADFVVELCNSLMGPVFSKGGQDVTQRVRPGDEISKFYCQK